jgi:hypothetical protein
MRVRIIAIVNRSRQLSRAEAELLVAACDVQLRRDAAPPWRMEPLSVRLYPSESRIPRSAVPIRIVDEPDEEDAEGYHWETDDGRPYGRVFVNAILGDATGEQRRHKIRLDPLGVSVALSHEVLEAFVDPDINLWALGRNNRMYAYEVCDPVQEQSYRVRIDGGDVYVSNFVYPTWFDLENVPHARYDHLRTLDRPFQIPAGGYAVYWNTDGDERELQGRSRLSAAKRHRAARTQRRRKRARNG